MARVFLFVINKLRWQVYSPHKGPKIPKELLCHDAFLSFTTRSYQLILFSIKMPGSWDFVNKYGPHVPFLTNISLLSVYIKGNSKLPRAHEWGTLHFHKTNNATQKNDTSPEGYFFQLTASTSINLHHSSVSLKYGEHISPNVVDYRGCTSGVGMIYHKWAPLFCYGV